MDPDRRGWDWARMWVVATREAHRVTRDHDLADDAAQEALVRAWRMRAQCRSPSAPDGWVAQIARNEALRASRRAGRRRRHEVRLDVDDRDADLRSAEAIPPAEQLDVRDALQARPADDRRLMQLRYSLELTQPEVARLLGVPEGTAKVRLHRARARLRALLAV